MVSIWEALPGGLGDSVLDEDGMRARVARDLRMAASLGLVTSPASKASEDAAVAIGLDRTDMLGIATGPTSMTYPFMGRAGPVRVEPTESVPTRALAPGAAEIADELVARLLLQLRGRADREGLLGTIHRWC